jgi:hypothetical protein
MKSVLGLEQRDDNHPLSASQAVSGPSEPTAEDFESVHREQAVETPHSAKLDRTASEPPQDRSGAPQDALKTVERGDSPRLAP